MSQHRAQQPSLGALSIDSSTNHASPLHSPLLTPDMQSTSLALRANDNTHARNISDSMAFSRDDTAEQVAVPAAEASDHGTMSATTPGGEKSSALPSDKPTSNDEDNMRSNHLGVSTRGSLWSRVRAAIKAQTRSGRREAQHAALEAEQVQQREMDPSPFPSRAFEYGELLDPKNVKLLRQRGGVVGILRGLGVDPNNGLDLPVDGNSSSSAEEKKLAARGDDLEADAKAPDSEDITTHKDFVHATQEERQRVYGANRLPGQKSKSLILLMWLALQDKILILLCIAAVVSLALGLYTDFGAPRKQTPCAPPPPGRETCDAPQVDWVEGVAILVAVVIVDLVGSLNDWQKERQFKKLNAKKEERDVKVIRQGRPALMNVHEVLVGDILQLEPGEIIPCDGIFLKGHNVKCDESGATGESDMIRKITYDECVRDLDHHRPGTKMPNRDCFLLSGSRVLEGVGEYVVVAVGPNSFNGKLMLSLRSDGEATPLQGKLNRLAELIAKLGASAGVLLFVALMIRFFVQIARQGGTTTPDEKAQSFIQILVISVTVIVVAVPEGLPLAVTLALAFATKRMVKQNLLVRVLGACETMANASVVCTDKTGTLTQNEMTVVAGSIGAHLKFAYELKDHEDRVITTDDNKQDQQHGTERLSSVSHREGRKDWAIDQSELGVVVDGPLRTLLNDAIAVNSTAFEEEHKDAEEVEESAAAGGLLSRLFGKKKAPAAEKRAQLEFVGSKTETALLKMTKSLGWEHYLAARERNEVVQMIPFSSERKAMGVVVRLREGGYRLYSKGASEVLSKACRFHVEVPQPGESNEQIIVQEFNGETRDNINKTIMFYANQTLRTIAICYRDFEQWPPAGATMVSKSDDDDDQEEAESKPQQEVDYKWLAQDMTLLAITGIEDPLRPGVKDAVAACARAGVQVKMCTGDNVLTARSIATQCGIFTPGGIIMEGPVFRKLSDADRKEVVPRLQVLARSSPEDKKILVESLKAMGEIVGVTGDGTNDGPALKTAHVGFSMGIAGTEVAKEASDIILMDDNFASIVSAICFGRRVNDAVRSFLQFQLSVNIVAVIVTFVTAVASEEEKSALTAVQLLWINLIMDTLAALALATDPAHPSLLDRKPDRVSAPLITVDMWKMIIGQSLYQLIVILVLNFAGPRIFNFNYNDPVIATQQRVELGALVFNAFVWCQLFSQINSRRLDRKLNIFEGVHRNPWFIGIWSIEVAAQILIVFVGGAAFSVTPLGGRDWAISIVVGLLCIPFGALIRLTPTKPIEELCYRYRLLSDPNALPDKSPESDEYVEKARAYETAALAEVAERLSAYSRIRGGRLRSSPIQLKTRARRMREADIHPQSLMALVPALIGASVGSGWKPTNPPEAHLADPAVGNPSLSSTELFAGKVQFHPETKNDPFYEKFKKAAAGMRPE